MPIWLLLSRLEYGGLERVQLNLAQTLQERGYNIRLVAGKLIAERHEESPTTFTVMEIARCGHWYFPVGLWRALRRDTPGIVFTTSNDVACLVLLLRRIAFRSLRVVVTQHSSLSAPLKHARGLTRIKLQGIRLAMRWLIPGADRIVAVSHAMAVDMHRELGIDMRCINVVHNPIVTRDFKARMNVPVSWPWSNRDLPTVIFAGRLAAEKRLDLLLVSFRQLIRTCPARLLIVGTGPQEEQLRKWISKNDLTEMCRLSGFAADPLSFMRIADVLVLASDFEGFGNVLVEAMACGTQVIATDCPCGPAEILEHGRYGQLVPCNDAAALGHAMRLALTQKVWVAPEILQRRANDFTLTRATRAYQHIIDSLSC